MVRVVAGDGDQWALGTLSSRRRVSGYRVQILRIPHQHWLAEDLEVLLELLR